MKRAKNYRLNVTQQPNGDILINYVLVKDKVNQFIHRWRPVSKRNFKTELLNNKLVTK